MLSNVPAAATFIMSSCFLEYHAQSAINLRPLINYYDMLPNICFVFFKINLLAYLYKDILLIALSYFRYHLYLYITSKLNQLTLMLVLVLLLLSVVIWGFSFFIYLR